MLLTQTEKKALVIKLAEDGLTTREIAKQVRISLGNIGKILREYMGEECSIDKKLSLDSRAFQMFREGKTPLDVSIHLNLDTESTMYLYQNYTRLSNLGDFIQIYNAMGRDLPIFIYSYQSLKTNGLATVEFIQDFINVYNTRQALKTESEEMTEYLIMMNRRKQQMENEIEVK